MYMENKTEIVWFTSQIRRSYWNKAAVLMNQTWTGIQKHMDDGSANLTEHKTKTSAAIYPIINVLFGHEYFNIHSDRIKLSSAMFNIPFKICFMSWESKWTLFFRTRFSPGLSDSVFWPVNEWKTLIVQVKRGTCYLSRFNLALKILLKGLSTFTNRILESS